jgi:hypothetical protein
MDPRDLELLDRYVDFIQIGARNMQNFRLLKEVGSVKKPIILKRGLSATIKDLLLSAEYIVANGNPNVILCERGIRTFEDYTRNTLDIAACRRSRAVTPAAIGTRVTPPAGRFRPALSRAGVAITDGLIVEVHPCRKNQHAQSLTMDGFGDDGEPAALIALWKDAPCSRRHAQPPWRMKPAVEHTTTEASALFRAAVPGRDSSLFGSEKLPRSRTVGVANLPITRNALVSLATLRPQRGPSFAWQKRPALNACEFWDREQAEQMTLRRVE